MAIAFNPCCKICLMMFNDHTLLIAQIINTSSRPATPGHSLPKASDDRRVGPLTRAGRPPATVFDAVHSHETSSRLIGHSKLVDMDNSHQHRWWSAGQ